jgi:hypothetical protein
MIRYIWHPILAKPTTWDDLAQAELQIGASLAIEERPESLVDDDPYADDERLAIKSEDAQREE